jgi:phage N-6-adenine-methyltransferase
MSVELPAESASVRKGPIQKPHRSRQDYETPRVFIDAVERRFGPLYCDLAATAENAKAPEWLSEPSDSLSVPWEDTFPYGILWINPPFGNIAPWAEKCAVESQSRYGLILLLTPASVGSEWYSKHVHRKAYVLLLSPRLSFDGVNPFPRDLMLSVYGYGLHGMDTWRWDR